MVTKAQKAAAAKRRRNRFTGINLVNAGEAYLQANWVTQGFLNTDPLAALIGKSSGGYGFLKGVSDTGAPRIAISELFGFGGESAEKNWSYVIKNVKDNWLDVTVKTVLTTGAFRVGKKILRKPRSQINAGIRMLGAGSFLKV